MIDRMERTFLRNESGPHPCSRPFGAYEPNSKYEHAARAESSQPVTSHGLPL